MERVSKIFVGVDVSSKTLDVHFYPLKKTLRVDNSVAGIRELINLLKKYDVGQIAFEATGGYEKKIIAEFKKAALDFWVVNPLRMRSFIRSEGRWAKTDRLDAEMIALFAAQKTPNYTRIDQDVALKELVSLRSGLRETIAGYEKKIKLISDEKARGHCQSIIDSLEVEIAALEEDIELYITQDPEHTANVERLITVPGVGKLTAAVLTAALPELGKISNRAIAALVGIAPFTRESGFYRGRARIVGGRFMVRKALYMATLTSVTHNPIIKKFYQKLKEQGKPSKVALVAAMRKLLIAINSMFRKGETWQTNIP